MIIRPQIAGPKSHCARREIAKGLVLRMQDEDHNHRRICKILGTNRHRESGTNSNEVVREPFSVLTHEAAHYMTVERFASLTCLP